MTRLGPFFAWAVIVLQALASVAYFSHGEWKRGLFWGFAAGINAVSMYL